jgi:hypothetical protein
MNHEALGNEILDYLSKHPEAEDSLEGIVEWWLVEQGITRPATEVRAALDQLVARKQISARQGPDGRTHYRACRRQSGGSVETMFEE